MNPRRALTSVVNIAALDIPQPAEIDLLTRVRLQLSGRAIEGTVVARTFEENRRYDVITEDGRIYPDEVRDSLTVLEMPSDEEVGRVRK